MTKQEVIQGMMKNEKIFVIFSARTRMPYVVCDPETFDDQIYLYLKEEDAQAEAKRLLESGEPVSVFVLTTKGFLAFYMNLYFMGVNCIVAGYHTDSCYSIQLTDFVREHRIPAVLYSGAFKKECRSGGCQRTGRRDESTFQKSEISASI